MTYIIYIKRSRC